MKVLKTYMVGLLVILVVIQPWYFGKWIGLNMDAGPFLLGYFWGVLLEALLIGILYLPYYIGKNIR